VISKSAFYAKATATAPTRPTSPPVIWRGTAPPVEVVEVVEVVLWLVLVVPAPGAGVVVTPAAGVVAAAGVVVAAGVVAAAGVEVAFPVVVAAQTVEPADWMVKVPEGKKCKCQLSIFHVSRI
jgi:hypothetical protein